MQEQQRRPRTFTLHPEGGTPMEGVEYTDGSVGLQDHGGYASLDSLMDGHDGTLTWHDGDRAMPRFIVDADLLEAITRSLKADTPHTISLRPGWKFEIVAGNHEENLIGKEHAEMDTIKVVRW